MEVSALYVKGIDISRLPRNAKSADRAYENLAIAVVAVAAADYRSLKRRLVYETSRGERNIIKGRMKEIEMFFKSDYGDVLSFGKADYLLSVLEAGG